MLDSMKLLGNICFRCSVATAGAGGGSRITLSRRGDRGCTRLVPRRPVGVPRLGNQLPQIFGRMHVHLAPHFKLSTMRLFNQSCQGGQRFFHQGRWGNRRRRRRRQSRSRRYAQSSVGTRSCPWSTRSIKTEKHFVRRTTRTRNT